MGAGVGAKGGTKARLSGKRVKPRCTGVYLYSGVLGLLTVRQMDKQSGAREKENRRGEKETHTHTPLTRPFPLILVMDRTVWACGAGRC